MKITKQLTMKEYGPFSTRCQELGLYKNTKCGETYNNSAGLGNAALAVMLHRRAPGLYPCWVQWDLHAHIHRGNSSSLNLTARTKRCEEHPDQCLHVFLTYIAAHAEGVPERRRLWLYPVVP